MIKLLPGYKIEALCEDCPFVAYHHNHGEEDEAVVFSVDVSRGFWDGKMTLQESIAEAEEKILMLIDALQKDPNIKSRIPKELIQGYAYQISVKELQDLLGKLIVVPGQLDLLSLAALTPNP